MWWRRRSRGLGSSRTGYPADVQRTVRWLAAGGRQEELPAILICFQEGGALTDRRQSARHKSKKQQQRHQCQPTNERAIGGQPKTTRKANESRRSQPNETFPSRLILIRIQSPDPREAASRARCCCGGGCGPAPCTPRRPRLRHRQPDKSRTAHGHVARQAAPLLTDASRQSRAGAAAASLRSAETARQTPIPVAL